MNMHDEFADQLSDYLDGELTDVEQRAVAAHLAGCPSCRQTLAELESVARTAAALPVREPASDLWHGIASRLEPKTPPHAAGGAWRFTFSLPQLAAASVVLALLSGWAATQIVSRRTPAPSTTAAVESTGGENVDADDRVVRASFDDAEYDAAVSDLKAALDKGRGTLDPATVAIIEDNLKTINQAVDEARQALAQDPANGFLSGYLVDTQRRQLDLLRHAAALANTAD